MFPLSYHFSRALPSTFATFRDRFITILSIGSAEDCLAILFLHVFISARRAKMIAF
jgi:hypothetical protein